MQICRVCFTFVSTATVKFSYTNYGVVNFYRNFSGKQFLEMHLNFLLNLSVCKQS